MLASTVEALVAEEKSRSHHVLAGRLQLALQTVPVTTSNEIRRPQAGGRDFVISPNRVFGSTTSYFRCRLAGLRAN